MKQFFAVLALLACPAGAQTQTDPAGHWDGQITGVPSGPSRITLDLARNAKGEWTASLGVPDKKISGLEVGDLLVTEKRVTFSSPTLPNNPVFELSFAGGKLSGTLAVGPASLPIEFTRTGAATVELAMASPAVSRQLEGDWEGGIALPNGDTRVVLVHFKNQPSGTVKATIDSPSQGAAALTLGDVIEKDRAVSFAVRFYGGSYKGTMNSEGMQIAGEWTQGSNPALPLTFKKK